MNNFLDNDSMDPVARTCQSCSGNMVYKGSGIYICEKCGEEYLSDFGKVKRFLEENGPSNAVEIAEATGVSRRVISDFIKNDRVEVVTSAGGYTYCASCGAAIRYGKYCPACAKKLPADGRKGTYVALVGELVEDQKGAMRFLNNNNE